MTPVHAHRLIRTVSVRGVRASSEGASVGDVRGQERMTSGKDGISGELVVALREAGRCTSASRSLRRPDRPRCRASSTRVIPTGSSADVLFRRQSRAPGDSWARSGQALIVSVGTLIALSGTTRGFRRMQGVRRPSRCGDGCHWWVGVMM